MVPVELWKAPPWLEDVRTVSLTRREAQILTGVCRGWSNSRIAKSMGLSMDQVKYSMRSMFHAMGAYDRTLCAVLAATGQVDILIEARDDRRLPCE